MQAVSIATHSQTQGVNRFDGIEARAYRDKTAQCVAVEEVIARIRECTRSDPPAVAEWVRVGSVRDLGGLLACSAPSRSSSRSLRVLIGRGEGGTARILRAARGFTGRAGRMSPVWCLACGRTLGCDLGLLRSRWLPGRGYTLCSDRP